MQFPCRKPCSALILCLLLSSYMTGQHASATGIWKTVPAPFRPVNVTAAGNVLFVCGADEMILSSKDNGITWEANHKNSDGEVLLNISFVDDKVGFAAGTGGLLLSTVDGGQGWKTHHGPDSIRSFSFADASNGIAVFSDSAHPPKAQLPPGTTSMEGSAKITHDGGDHWDDITALNSSELRGFTRVLSVAALDSAHFLMLRRQPNVEDAFVVTNDGGRSWKLVHMQNDTSNRVMARTVFIHQGEYWAFGMELVHREKGGGYGVPLVMHSKDGETWIHGNRGAKEFEACTAQGCYLWDGTLEVLYGEHEQFWALPQDGTLSDKWAIAGATVCTVNRTLKCASATSTDKPQPHPGGGVYAGVSDSPLAEGCLECRVEPIVPDNPGSPSISRVQASFTIQRDGSVANVSVKSHSKRMDDLIADQLSKWLFEPAHHGDSTIEVKRDMPMLLMCEGFPGQPETARCSLHPPEEFSRARNQ